MYQVWAPNGDILRDRKALVPLIHHDQHRVRRLPLQLREQLRHRLSSIDLRVSLGASHVRGACEDRGGGQDKGGRWAEAGGGLKQCHGDGR